MLTRYDELTCHQDVSTFDHPTTSDRAWTEKIWVHVHDTTGQLTLATGFGVYPNRNVMDGYGCVNIGNERQHNLRLSRELRPKIDEIFVGPLSYDVLEPYRRIRVAMKENDHGLSYDLEFLGRFEPGEESPQWGRSRGRLFVNTCRYAQTGRARGWIKVDGKKYEVDETSYRAHRDHSWGIRMGVGAPETGVQETDVDTFLGMMINWLCFQFDDFGLYCYLIERADGRVQRLSGAKVRPLGNSTQTEQIPIVGVEHDFSYHEGGARMAAGTMKLHFESGESLELSMKELTTMYLRGGGYIGYDGFYHGIWKGPSWSAGEIWEVGSPKVADEVHGLDDTVCEVRCGDQVGYGIIENLILPPFPKYGF